MFLAVLFVRAIGLFFIGLCAYGFRHHFPRDKENIAFCILSCLITAAMNYMAWFVL